MTLLRFAAIVLVLGATPAAAQDGQPAEGAGFGEAVRGFFNRMFGAGGPVAPDPAPGSVPGPEPAPADRTPAPRSDEPARAPVAVENPPAGSFRANEQVKSAPPLVKTPTFSQALHASIVRGDTLTTLKLIEQGADIEAKDPGAGASPLHYAVMTGRMPIIELLLQRGADAKSVARNGSAPLHTAVRYHRLEVADLLIENGAEVNVKDANGMTPLGLALAMKNEPLSALLRERGAR